MSHADIAAKFPVGIDEGFVSSTAGMYHCVFLVLTLTKNVFPMVLLIVMFFFLLVLVTTAAESLIEASTGQKTMEKKNRKKRAAKNKTPDSCISNMRINSDVDGFYTKFLRVKYFKPNNS